MLRTVEFTLTGLAHGRPFAADATWQPTGQPQPVVVFVHGFKGFKDWGHFGLLARFFAERGFVFVKLNLSHNGVVVGGTGDFLYTEGYVQSSPVDSDGPRVMYKLEIHLYWPPYTKFAPVP